MANTQSPASTLRAAWIAQAQASPWVTAGLGGSLLAVLVLLLASGYNALDNGDQGNLRYALAGGSAGFAATAFGA